MARTCTIHRSPRKLHRLHRERDDIFHHVHGYHRCAMNSTRLKGAAVECGKPGLSLSPWPARPNWPGPLRFVWWSASPRSRGCASRARTASERSGASCSRISDEFPPDLPKTSWLVRAINENKISILQVILHGSAFDKSSLKRAVAHSFAGANR